MRYIDAEKLKSIIKVQIKERKEWMKNIDKSDRQNQLWSDLNGEDMSILRTINSIQQEQSDMDFEREFAKFSNNPDAMNYVFPIDLADYKDFARHFYNLCKNTLMAWAKKNAEELQIEAAGCSNMLAAGEFLAYDKLIEKIESM